MPWKEHAISALRKWRIKADKTMFSLKTIIEKKMLKHMQGDKTPKETWGTFVTLFSKKNNTRFWFLDNELLSISQCNMKIAQYLHRVKSICQLITKLDPKFVIGKARMKRIIIHGLWPEYWSSIQVKDGATLNHPPRWIRKWWQRKKSPRNRTILKSSEEWQLKLSREDIWKYFLQLRKEGHVSKDYWSTKSSLKLMRQLPKRRWRMNVIRGGIACLRRRRASWW